MTSEPTPNADQVSIFGAAPEAWRVDRIRDRLSAIVGGEWGDDPDAHDEGVEIPVIRVADIRGLDLEIEDLTIRRVKESKLPNRLIGKRTVLFEKSGGGEQKPVGRAVLGRNLSCDAICSNFMAKTECGSTLDPLFAVYLLDAAYSAGVNVAHIQQTTGIQNLRVFDYLNTHVALPLLTEQQRIAAYLDTSCAAIDAAVSAKLRQLETLEALRKSIIHAVFADNGGGTIERVKDVAAKITSGVTPDGGSAGYLESGIPLLRSQNVHFGGLRLDDVAYISEETHTGMKGSQLKPRDVLLNITGASIGRCTFVPDGFGEGNVNQHVCVIRSGPLVDHLFLTDFLSSSMGQDQIFSTFTGASRQGLSHSDLGLIRIPFPKMNVQREIVSKIEHHDFKHRNIRGCIESQIVTLTAYRKSLIHECVTGQRRVTEAEVRHTIERSAGPTATVQREKLNA